jgi:hypothetical protein
MAVLTSTGLGAYIAVTGSLKAALEPCLIKVYGGTKPATADSAASATVLWTISLGGDGTPLEFADEANGRSLVKPEDAIWGGPTAAGTATHFRIVKDDDDGTASETAIRVQGIVGTLAGSDMFMSNLVLLTDAATLAKTLTAFSLTLPSGVQ